MTPGEPMSELQLLLAAVAAGEPMSELQQLLIAVAVSAESIPPEDAADGCMYYRVLPDGDVISVWPMTFGKARLCLRYVTSPKCTYDDGWCYADPVRCILAAALWDGESDPIDGWHKHVNSGRRRIDGDPAQETQRW